MDNDNAMNNHQPSNENWSHTVTQDPIEALARMAHHAGIETHPRIVLADLNCEAGTITAPLRDSGDFDVTSAAMLDCVLREAQARRWLVDSSERPEMWTARLLYGCRLGLKMLPPVLIDLFDRFVLELDEDGQPPHVAGLENDVSRAVDRLQQYLAASDAGDWTCSNVMAGALADIHDSVRLVAIWHATWGLAAKDAGCGCGCAQ